MLAPGFANWKILLDDMASEAVVEAKAIDAAGNEEKFTPKRKMR